MNRTMRTATVVGVALVAASVAAWFVYTAVSQLPGRVVEVRQVPVVVATDRLPVGTSLEPAQVKVVQWPADSPPPGAIASVEAVVGRGLIEAVSANEPITTSKVAERELGAGVPPLIPPGMRAISVRVNEVIGVGWSIAPRMRVDVLVTIESTTSTVVSNVQILTSGTTYDQERARREGRSVPPGVVTLLVTPEQSARIALASAQGQITLTLRNPLDTDPGEVAGVSLASLVSQRTPAPAAPAAPTARPRPAPRVEEPPPPPPPPVYSVEAIRGGKRSHEEVIQ